MGKKEGMGLNNITKKVEQLNGTFNIDSFEGKGTTILIDIPL
jgi:signal transduction histidine kinase